LAKIAVEFESIAARRTDGHTTGQPARRALARGEGWSVSEVICSAGPRDRPFEERHSHVCIAIVTAGSFQYRSSAGRELLTPGSLLLGNAGQHFECGHEHGVGDRCLSFSYEPQYFEGLAAEAGVQSRSARFSTLRVPPVRELAPDLEIVAFRTGGSPTFSTLPAEAPTSRLCPGAGCFPLPPNVRKNP